MKSELSSQEKQLYFKKLNFLSSFSTGYATLLYILSKLLDSLVILMF